MMSVSGGSQNLVNLPIDFQQVGRQQLRRGQVDPTPNPLSLLDRNALRSVPVTVMVTVRPRRGSRIRRACLLI